MYPFFLGLEKKKQKNATNEFLTNGNGEKITEQEGILNTVQNFYKNLLQKKTCNRTQVALLLEGIDKHISKEDRQLCEKSISVEEVERAIEKLSREKSPGCDGLAAEVF